MLRPSAVELVAMPALAGKSTKDTATSSTDREKGAVKKNQFRSNSQARAADSGSKIELLQTIRLPRNLKQLNEVLPKQNYAVPEAEIKETLYSEKPGEKRGSNIQYDAKLNYESDAVAVQKKGEKKAREHRAARFRERS